MGGRWGDGSCFSIDNKGILVPDAIPPCEQALNKMISVLAECYGLLSLVQLARTVSKAMIRFLPREAGFFCNKVWQGTLVDFCRSTVLVTSS